MSSPADSDTPRPLAAPARASGRRRKRLGGEKEGIDAAEAGRIGQPPELAPRRAGGLSKLTLRVLAVNLIALCVPVVGVLYLGQVEEELVAAELESLRVEGSIVAAAMAEGAVVTTPDIASSLESEMARQMVRRLYETTASRTRLFASDGALIADSRLLVGPGGVIEVELLEELEPVGAPQAWFNRVYDWVVGTLPRRTDAPVYREPPEQAAADYPIVERALAGSIATQVYTRPEGGRLLAVAVPVQRLRAVLGAVMLTHDGTSIDSAMRSVRADVLRVFAVALLVTVALSLYLSGTITRPVRRLAAAAERVRRGQGRRGTIPDFSDRDDEIGDLSHSLREMTAALYARMDAIEHFAADVAHEIKNPLTSLRSAVETIARISDPDQQKRLMSIILEDVQRLNRLITDISDASRLDAELSRADVERVDLAHMLHMLADLHRPALDEAGIALDLRVPPEGRGDLIVAGLESRLVQVFRNLIGNAISFAPRESTLTIDARREGGTVTVRVGDRGPGIPPAKLEAIFDRFYSERPKQEKFGTHSGLGLSISKQIVEAHGGQIIAENRRDGSGAIFTVRIPI